MLPTTRPTRLYDTTVFIDHLQGHAPAATDLVQKAMHGDCAAAFSILTEVELWAGIRNTKEEKIHRTLLNRLSRLHLTVTIARRAGELRLHYRHRHLKLGDAVIAATAEYHHIPLYTKNIKDFEFIETIQVVGY